MKRLLIVGAGGFGRELASWCAQHPDCDRSWTFAGFLDDEKAGHFGAVIGTIRDYVPREADLLACGIGTPEGKRIVGTELIKRGARFATIIHPTAVIGERVQLGSGVVLCPGAVVTCDVRLGDFVMLNCHATVGHDVVIGDYATLSSHCDITGRCQIGEGAFFGTSSCVIPGRRVGAWATVGAGAVVCTTVRERTTVFGNPARILKAC